MGSKNKLLNLTFSVLFMFLFMVLLPTSLMADNSNLLAEYFGSFRTTVYGNITNVYSGRFFSPTSNIEPSVKLRSANGSPLKTFNYNLEVPIEKDPNTIFLKFLFLEVPVEGAQIVEQSNGLHVTYDGLLQERLSDENWATCHVHYDLRIEKLKGTDTLKVDLIKQGAEPCTSSENHFQLERVIFSP